MKIIFSTLILISITLSQFSCYSKLWPGTGKVNQVSKDNNGDPMLLGICTEEGLKQPPYGNWFNTNYSAYQVDTSIAETMKGKLLSKRFLIFMGTWCSDSKREVPCMFKILDYCGIPSSQIRLITLSDLESDYKQSPRHEEKGLNIHRVPDLIVFSGNKELGRIIESPVNSLEKDLFEIVNDENYQAHYKIVSFLANLLQKNKTLYTDQDLNALAERIMPMAVSSGELNTYGYVLLAAHQTDKSRIVFRLNTLLYPNNANTFLSLADYYINTSNSPMAKESLRKAIGLQPDNQDAKKKLQQLEQR